MLDRYMEALAERFLAALKEEPKDETFKVISAVIQADLPVPRSVLLIALSRVAIAIRKTPPLADSAMATLYTAICHLPALPIYTETASLEPWLAIALEGLVLRTKTAVAEQRRRAWKLLVELMERVKEPAAAYSCFPGLFKAALSEARSTVNQEVGSSFASLGSAVELVGSLIETVLADKSAFLQVTETREKAASALDSLLACLLTCLQSPNILQSPVTLQRISAFLYLLILSCPSLVIQHKSRFLPLLIYAQTTVATPAPELPFALLPDLSQALLVQLEALGADSRLEDYKKFISSWKLLGRDQAFFISSHSSTVLAALRTMCAFRLPAITGFRLSENALDEFSALGSGLKEERRRFFEEMRPQGGISLEIMDALRKKEDYKEYCETAFCVFLMPLKDAFQTILSDLQLPASEKIPVNQQDLYRLFLKSGLIGLLDCLEMSPFERLLSLIQLWEEAADDLISTRFQAISTSENADLPALLCNYAPKILQILPSFLRNLPQGSQIVSAYLRYFGPKDMPGIVRMLLEELDVKVTKVRKNEAAGLIKGLNQALSHYPAAVSAGILTDGNLAREVLLRLKPLLAWKREKGRNLLAFETLKLFSSLVPVLDSLPLSIDNSSSCLFALHEDSNVTIPKALPALLHEFFPSLLSLCRALVLSQDYACVAKVLDLLAAATRRNPGFMDRREAEIRPFLEECSGLKPEISTYRRLAYEAAMGLIATLRPESQLRCLTK